jgi:hypothetical protein
MEAWVDAMQTQISRHQRALHRRAIKIGPLDVT